MKQTVFPIMRGSFIFIATLLSFYFLSSCSAEEAKPKAKPDTSKAIIGADSGKAKLDTNKALEAPASAPVKQDSIKTKTKATKIDTTKAPQTGIKDTSKTSQAPVKKAIDMDTSKISKTPEKGKTMADTAKTGKK